MSLVHIKTDDVILELTVTTDISFNESTDVTQHKMEFGSVVTDNTVNKNRTFSFNGLLSEIKSFLIVDPEPIEGNDDFSGNPKPNQKGVTDYYNELQKIRNNRDLVTLFFDNRLHGDGFENCIITSVMFERNKDLGNAYQVSMTLEQVRISDRALQSERREVKNPDLNSEEVDGSTTPTQEIKKPDGTLGLQTTEYIRGLFNKPNTGDN